MKLPQSPGVLPLVLALASSPALAHDDRFSEEPTKTFLQIGKVLDFGGNATLASRRGHLPPKLAQYGAEACLLMHRPNKPVDYKPCLKVTAAFVPVRAELDMVFNLAHVEMDILKSDGLYVSYGAGIKFRKDSKYNTLFGGTEGQIQLGWRGPSDEPGLGAFFSAGPIFSSLMSFKPLPNQLLDGDGDVTGDETGLEGGGDFGAENLNPVRARAVYTGATVRVGVTF